MTFYFWSGADGEHPALCQETVSTLLQARQPIPFIPRHPVPAPVGVTEDRAEMGWLGPCLREAACEPRTILKCFPHKEK